MTKKQKHGNVEIPKDEFEPKNIKVRISMMIPGDVLDGYKKASKECKKPYQVLMQEKLREALFGNQVDVNLRKTIREVIREELKKAV